MRTQYIWLSVVLGLCLAMVGACGDDSDGDEGSHHGDGDGDHHGDDLVEACQAIMDVCHEVDTGEGEISECHTIAHENVEADCLAEQDRCIPLCEAAAADGGAHDGGEHDEETDHHEE